MPLKDKEQQRLYNKQYHATHPAQCTLEEKLAKKLYMKQWRAENKQKVQEWRKDHYAKNRSAILQAHDIYRAEHRAEINAQAKAYATAHPEKMKARSHTYEKTHREQRRVKNKTYRLTHKDITQAQGARRRALKKKVPINDFTATQWSEMKAHYGHRCVYCGRKMQRLTQDHITPLIAGGSHTQSNIVPACQSCNSMKGKGNPLKAIQPLLL